MEKLDVDTDVLFVKFIVEEKVKFLIDTFSLFPFLLY